jgi:origin recognition complex subunit 1
MKDEEDMSWGSGMTWNVAIQEPRSKSGTKKRKLTGDDDCDVESEDEYQASEDGEDEEGEEIADVEEEEGEQSDSEPVGEDEVIVPRTPSKKRARRDLAGTSSPRKSTTATPRKRSTNAKPIAQPTPHSKKAAAARRRKQLEGQSSPSKKKQKFTVRPRTFPPLDWNQIELNLGPKDPWLRAMHMLHAGNRPDSLPCRDTEFENVLKCVGELLEEGSGGCICECSVLN